VTLASKHYLNPPVTSTAQLAQNILNNRSKTDRAALYCKAQRRINRLRIQFSAKSMMLYGGLLGSIACDKSRQKTPITGVHDRATPIKPTPFLRGKAARRFEENMRQAEQNPVSRQEYERIMSVYRSVKIVDKRIDF